MNVEQHRAYPDISVDRHVKRRVVELGEALDSKTAIYLDLKFWILLRETALGRNTNEASLELLALLRVGVAEGRLFCPISESVFLELLKQSDPASRLATARLIDELSLSVTLLHHQARLGTELAHFVHGFESGSDRLHPLRHLVWTKLSYVLGILHPSSTPFDAATELAIQKAFFDHMWTMPLAGVIEQIDGTSEWRDLTLGDIAGMLNTGIEQHAHEARSFEKIWADELLGAVDLCLDMAVEIVSDIGEKKASKAIERGTRDWKRCRAMCGNVLFHALKTRPECRLQLRSMYIEACLHAAFRRDKKRRFTGNDLYDFNHASAALAHCQAFFTERPLKTLIESKNIALGELFPSRVVCDVADAILYLKQLDTPEGQRQSLSAGA